MLVKIHLKSVVKQQAAGFEERALPGKHELVAGLDCSRFSFMTMPKCVVRQAFHVNGRSATGFEIVELLPRPQFCLGVE
jgi:hypothetical protein